MAGRFAGARMGMSFPNKNVDKRRSKSKARGSDAGQKSPGKVRRHTAQKTLVKSPMSKSRGNKTQFRHRRYDLIVNIDLVEYGLTDDLVAEFKEAFMLVDKDEDGLISPAELGLVMKSLGQRPSDTELQNLVRGISTCVSGYIEFNEFLQMMSRKLKCICNEDELKDAFKVFDKSNCGYLTSEQFRYVMTSMGERLTTTEVDDMINEASPTGDGIVNYLDFVNILSKKN